ncbi:MAG: lysophospholipase [Phycisphaerales bacterium]|nr:lysophospholipase [Phycisphaerales bacterium]
MMCPRLSEEVAPEHRELRARFVGVQNNGVLAQFADVIRSVSVSTSTAVADVYEAWANLSANGVDTTAMLANGLNHPSGDAHRIAAEVLMKVIEGAWDGREGPVLRRTTEP